MVIFKGKPMKPTEMSSRNRRKVIEEEINRIVERIRRLQLELTELDAKETSNQKTILETVSDISAADDLAV
jgi:hypothetical protein